MVQMSSCVTGLRSISRLSVGLGFIRRNGTQRPDLDFDYLLNPSNLDLIKSIITKRKRVGDIEKVHNLWARLSVLVQTCASTSDPSTSENGVSRNDLKELWDEFYEEAQLIPNKIHPSAPIGPESNARVLHVHKNSGPDKSLKSGGKDAESLLAKAKLLRTDMGRAVGEKCYVFLAELAELEQALINYTLDFLVANGFKYVHVDDIVPVDIPKKCGLIQRTVKNILYPLAQGDKWCLSGTGEMGIAALLQGRVLEEAQLPLKLATVSRCFRPETSEGKANRGIYRVHEFTKVEMFAVTANDEEAGEAMFQELVDLQKMLNEQLDLDFRILEMPSEELGAAAYRKVDLEAWMPSRKFFGEITSASNCIDFQSRRLNLRYKGINGLCYPYTLNGTACACPRTIIALIEQKQAKNHTVPLPDVLQAYFDAGVVRSSAMPMPIGVVLPKSDFSLR